MALLNRLTPDQQDMVRQAMANTGAWTGPQVTPTQAAYLATQFAPGAGALDAMGGMPSAPSSSQSLLDYTNRNPSMVENFRQGNYGTAAMQGLGLLGDATYAAGPLIGGTIGTALKTPRTIQKIAQSVDIPPAINSQKTQLGTSTVPSYEKAGNVLGEGKTLDYGAGRGIGAEKIGADTFEPFPREGFNPTYDRSSDIPSNSYKNITSLNVLNVMPKDVRDAAVMDIGRILEPGGTAVITTRGRDVMSAKGAPGPEEMSVITTDNTYQKGFKQPELREYIGGLLGPQYAVENIPGVKIGQAGVLVKKQESPYALSNIDPRYSPRYSPSKGMSGAEQTAMAPGIFPTIESRNLGIPTVSIFDFEGRPFMTTMSDRTAAGGLLTGLNGVNFSNPVNLRGGQDYMFDLMNSGQVWASDPKVVEQMMAAAKDLGESPLFLPWRMAPSGGDYATMTAETMVKYANQSMGAEDINRLNKIIREDGVNVSVKRKDPKNPEKDKTIKINIKVPEFLGLDNPLAGEQMKELTGNQRKAILKILDTKGRDSGGLSLSQARLAVSDQLQLNAMDAGLQNVGSVNTQRGILDISGHPTYGAGLPGEGIGRLQENIGVYELLPELARFRAANAKTSTALQNPLMPSATDKRALQMKPYTGILTEDMLRAIQNRMASQR